MFHRLFLLRSSLRPCYCGSQTVCHGRIRFETNEQKCVIQFEVAQNVFSKQDLFYSVHVIEIYVSVYCS
jgi:hypothetical protein